MILLSESLNAQSGIRSAVDAYVAAVQGKGAKVELQVRSTNISVSELKNVIQTLALSSGQKPNSFLLIGGFPHPRVDGQNASGENLLIYSDLPYEAPSDRYYAVSEGVYKVTPAAAGTPMSLQRAVFWIDFSTHSATNGTLNSSTAKYLAFITKMKNTQVNANYSVSFKPQLNLFVDDFWANQPHEVSTNAAVLKAYVGTSRSTAGGFIELAGTPADFMVSMAHANAAVLGFGSKVYLPSNDSSISQIYSVTTDGSPSFFNGVSIKSKHLNLYDCYAGDPSAANNVVSSILLNPASTVVSAVASTTSGAMSNWNGYIHNNALALGNSAAHAFLIWSRDNYFDGPNLHFTTAPSGDGIQDLGNKWNTGVMKYGDPLAKASR